MSGARQHHFLSEFYIEGFTKSGASSGRIHVLDLTTGRSWNQIPREIATRRDFYSADIPGVDRDEAEKGLARVEDILAPVIRMIRATRTLPTDERELDYLLHFVAMTGVRVPKFRQIMARPFVAFAEHYMQATIASPNAFEAFRDDLRRAGRPSSVTYEQMKAFVASGEYTVDVDPPTHLQNLFLGTEQVFQWLSRQAWSLVIADDTAPDFVFSDCPVVLFHNAQHWNEWGLPAQRMPTEAVMPLSRRLLLWGLTSTRCILPPVNADAHKVAGFNTFIVAQAERYVFSSDGRITWRQDQGKLGTTESLMATILGD